jgi:tetratricopeptide (TPR) repeat protein/predicted Ser/Thr protein kinase
MSTVRDQLGQYDILGPLGAGGMGEVYVARDPVLGRKVAIKVLPLRLSGDRDTLARFTQEARSASALNHPNIVTIHEVGFSPDGAPYIVMEYVEGKDLRSYVNEGPPANKKMLDIAAQIADGLAAAHERGIVHRDLKPENLMVTNDGFVKILDFGLAKIIRPTPGETEVTAQLEMPGTTPGTILGTVGYMSPEQATGRAIDFRSDQFALGAILYELATGKPAFDGDTAIDTLSAILHDDSEPIQKINARAPTPFCWIVGRLLSKDPNDRYASTRDVAHELRAIRDHIATMASGSEISFRPPSAIRKPLVIVGLLVAVAAVLAFVIEKKPFLSPPAAAKKYLAVMRFKDLTGDPNGQFVVDGFGETLMTRLAHFPNVQVMRPAAPDAPVSSDARQVARDLGANIVLTGSMQRSGDLMRVSYRLIDADRNSDSRSELLDGPTSDLFGLQDRLAESVASALNLGASRAKPPTLDPALSQERYLEALGYLRRTDNENSIDKATSILEELNGRGDSATIQASLGRAYLAKFQLTKDAKWAAQASVACERALARDPQNTEVHITLGELRRRTGRHEDALAEFQRVLSAEPNNADAVAGLAETYKSAGDLTHAEAAYRRAIALQPNFWSWYNRLGGFYLAHGRYIEAVTMFQKVITLVPDSLWGHNNLGGAYEQLGRYDDAISEFQKAINKKPTGQAYSNIGTCLYFLGRFDEAANAFEHAVQLASHNTLYWANLGDAYRWSSTPTKAHDAYQQAVKLGIERLALNPRDAFEQATLALCLAKLGRKREADEHIATAQQIDSQDVIALYRAATIANIEKNPERATRLLEAAIARGYSRSEVARDPEFENLRKNGTIATLLGSKPNN